MFFFVMDLSTESARILVNHRVLILNLGVFGVAKVADLDVWLNCNFGGRRSHFLASLRGERTGRGRYETTGGSWGGTLCFLIFMVFF